MSENKAFQVKEDSFFSSSAKASERKVRLFSTPGCPYCFTLKEFLKEHNVSFGEIDVSEDEKSRDYIIEKTGKMEAPIVEIDGEIVVGFDKEKICKLLKLKE